MTPEKVGQEDWPCIKLYYKQHDDQRMVEQASKIDFRLEVPNVG